MKERVRNMAKNKGIYISRAEQFRIYFWTGSNWNTDKSKAKLFSNVKAAQAEMKTKNIEWTINYNQE
jgi:hypothetical protein